MANEDYNKAQKLGIKAYKAAIAEGKNPYLPVLDELVSLSEIEREVHLGVSEILLSQVVGTSTLKSISSDSVSYRKRARMVPVVRV